MAKTATIAVVFFLLSFYYTAAQCIDIGPVCLCVCVFATGGRVGGRCPHLTTPPAGYGAEPRPPKGFLVFCAVRQIAFTSISVRVHVAYSLHHFAWLGIRFF